MSSPLLPPRGDRSPEDPLAGLIRAEQAFAEAARNQGSKQAFLGVWHPLGVLFSPAPVQGREHHLGRSDSAALLSWYPAFAEIDAEGRWAYTSGPWEYREDPTALEPLERGRFFSVWCRGEDDRWRLMADGPCPSAPSDSRLRPLQPGDGARPAQPLGLKPDEASRLWEMDRDRFPVTGQLAYFHGTEGGRIWFRLWFRSGGPWRLRIAWEETP